MKCSTVLLIYNEEGNIESLTKSILASYDRYSIDGEVVLVDDGSIDRSGKICDELAEKNPRVRAVHHNPNKGRSYAIRTGFIESRGEIVVIMDGDKQYDPNEIPKFLEKIDEGYDVVSGWRHTRLDNIIRRTISRVYNKYIVRGRFRLDVKDQNSGFKAFRRDKALNMGFNPEGYIGLHRYILPLAAIKGMTITEIPISHFDRPSGKSYIKFYTVPFITLRDYFKFNREHRDEIKAYRRLRKAKA